MWISLTIVVALLAHASSGFGWVLVTIIGVVPPLLTLTLWNDGPPPTIAEVLHTVELER